MTETRPLAGSHADRSEVRERDGQAVARSVGFVQRHAALGERQRLFVPVLEQVDVRLVAADRREDVVGRDHRREAFRLPVVSLAGRHLETEGRAVAGSAVMRNRVKRATRESFRLNRALLPAADIVVQARGGARQRDEAELRRSLDWHWQELIKRCKES